MALTGIPLDTSLEALRVQADILRRLGTEGRAKAMFELCAQMREIMEAGVRLRHPHYDEEQVRLATIRLCLGAELFHEVYPGIEISP